MFKLALNLLFCFLFGALTRAQDETCETTRKPDQVIQLFRHGARAPLSLYEGSAWTSSDLGQLTILGLKQEFYLGKNLSELYPELFGSTYSPEDIYVLANNVTRTIQSAIVQLSSIYLGKCSTLANDSSPQELEQYALMQLLDDYLPENEKFSGDVVPVHVDIVDSTNELIFQGVSSDYCPNLNTWMDENHNDARAREIWCIFSDLIAAVNKNLSQPITNIDEFLDFGDVAIANKAANKAIPGNITDPDLISNITFAFQWLFFHVREGQQIQRQLTSFNTFQAFLDQLASFRQGQTDAKKIAFFSGHDTNLISILGALGILSDDCLDANFKSYAENQTLVYPNCYYPRYASDIIIEFYNETTDPYVKFYYNNVSISLCGNANATCSYQDFVALVSNVTGNLSSETYQSECNCAPPDSQNQEIHALCILAVIVATVVFSSVDLKGQKKGQEILPLNGGAHGVAAPSMAEEEQGEGAQERNFLKSEKLIWLGRAIY